jgi:hypothetical protein
MALPFTRDQFLEVFGAYNQNLWPGAVVLWLGTVWALVIQIRRRPAAAQFISWLLLVHWIWAAAAYHAAFFTRINSAAWLFGGMFLIEGGLLVREGVVGKRLRFTSGGSLRHGVAWVLIVYALAYPFLALAEGNDWPRSPTFGIPCPTTILTIGFLVAADRPTPISTAVVPLLWAFIGGSAAFLLGVRTDLMLLAAGLGLLIYLIGTRQLRHKHSQ